jgi:hypothetical protein
MIFKIAVKLATALQVSMDVFCGVSNNEPSKLEQLAAKASKLAQKDTEVLEKLMERFLA